jgi:hypothetical protein
MLQAGIHGPCARGLRSPTPVPPTPTVVNGCLRFLLALWTILFLVISCAPLLTGNAVAGGAGLLAGAVFLVPWLIGVLILAILIWLTNPRRWTGGSPR